MSGVFYFALQREQTSAPVAAVTCDVVFVTRRSRISKRSWVRATYSADHPLGEDCASLSCMPTFVARYTILESACPTLKQGSDIAAIVQLARPAAFITAPNEVRIECQRRSRCELVIPLERLLSSMAQDVSMLQDMLTFETPDDVPSLSGELGGDPLLYT